MKVAIGYHVQDGPWGGGNQFAKSLASALQARGDSVCFDLADTDIDLIVLTDPRAHSPNVSFSAGAILRYLMRHPRTLVVHRINECDERKGTRNMNRMLRWANYCTDHTVFIASWLRNLAVWRHESPESVVLNGADAAVFSSAANMPWNGTEPLRLVTHHWGGNHLKGFDVYAKLDELLGPESWRQRLQFTYIGNLPTGFSFKSANYLSPLQGRALAQELSKHHVYISASVNEPAGMHHIEGALAGLPILYRDSGALPEYCKGFGIQFANANFMPALEEMFLRYPELKAHMSAYPYSAEVMCKGYLALFDQLLAQRDVIVQARRLWRSPLAVLRALVFL